ncbi:hypothetical protein, partial [Nocardiopsis salina]|uniref:hypothetical protein n=1 Tax=Nocardiopsis salina TaxID=245836 RepID=UPI0012687070
MPLIDDAVADFLLAPVRVAGLCCAVSDLILDRGHLHVFVGGSFAGMLGGLVPGSCSGSGSASDTSGAPHGTQGLHVVTMSDMERKTDQQSVTVWLVNGPWDGLEIAGVYDPGEIFEVDPADLGAFMPEPG